MTKDEALRMALEALDALCINDYSGYELGKRDAHLVDNALTAIKEALAQPTPDPVAFLYTLEYGKTVVDKKVSIDQLNYPFGVCGADYQAKNEDGVSYVRQTSLYTTPQPRTWIGLFDTDEGVLSVANMNCDDKFKFALAIEAKLKQKNGYAEEKNT